MIEPRVITRARSCSATPPKLQAITAPTSTKPRKAAPPSRW